MYSPHLYLFCMTLLYHAHLLSNLVEIFLREKKLVVPEKSDWGSCDVGEDLFLKKEWNDVM